MKYDTKSKDDKNSLSDPPKDCNKPEKKLNPETSEIENFLEKIKTIFQSETKEKAGKQIGEVKKSGYLDSIEKMIPTQFTKLLNSSITPVNSKLNEIWGSMNFSLPDPKGIIGGVMTKSLDSTIGTLLDQVNIPEIIERAQDPKLHPEINKRAKVRLGKEISVQEKDFLLKRKNQMRQDFANFIGVDISEVDPQDIPTIAIGGSGGGYRAMISFLGGITAANKIGLWDCTSYVAGVSGSCWAINGFFTAGNCDVNKLNEHFRDRVSIAPTHLTTFLNMAKNPFLAEHLIAGLVRKYHCKTDMSLADIFGTLLASRLWITEKPSKNAFDHQFKLSAQAQHIQTGKQPMPIYTAIHRLEEENTEDIKKSGPQPFRWFEFTPFEMGSLEIGAWIPTWSLGRQFRQGVSISCERELESSFLMGMFGSAFCATVAHIADELTPNLPTPVAGWYKSLAEEYYQNMLTIHPITPSQINNPFYSLNVPQSNPNHLNKLSQIFNQQHLSLMDAGMDNNLPLYPLLHPNRDVDVILVLDASDEVHTTPWFPKTDGYAKSLGKTRWQTGLNPWHKPQEKPFTKVFLAPSINDNENPISVLYFPLQAHPDVSFDPTSDPVCSTYNFAYEAEPYNQLAKVSEANVSQFKETICDVVKKSWALKRDARLG